MPRVVYTLLGFLCFFPALLSPEISYIFPLFCWTVNLMKEWKKWEKKRKSFAREGEIVNAITIREAWIYVRGCMCVCILEPNALNEWKRQFFISVFPLCQTYKLQNISVFTMSSTTVFFIFFLSICSIFALQNLYLLWNTHAKTIYSIVI